MNTTNLKITINIIIAFSLIAFLYQLIIYKNFNDLLCIFIIFLSNIITIFYCFNKKYFFNYPISLLMIFFSHFMNLGGALYLKSIEFTLLTEGLRLPLSTIFNLAIFNLLIILGHKIYVNNKITNNIEFSLNNLFNNLKFFEVKDLKLLYILSVLAIIGKFFYFDPSRTLNLADGGDKGTSIIKDVFWGVQNFIFIPVIIFFSPILYDTKIDNKKNNFFFIIYFLLIIFVALGSNGRSIMYDFIFLFGIIFFLLFLFDKITPKKNRLIKILLFFLFLILSINFLENVSKNFIIERETANYKTPMENVKSFITGINNSKNIEIYNQKNTNESMQVFKENYYKNSIYNRVNFLLVNDNINYLRLSLSTTDKENIKDYLVNKIYTIVPQPIINLFTDDFDKRDYRNSVASILYKNFDYKHGAPLNIGSSLFSLHIFFDKWIYLILLFFFIPFFIFFDAFYNKKTMIFSPFIIIFFYSTGAGIFNFIAATDVSVWFSFAFRTIPQSLIIILIIRFIYQSLLKKD